VFRRQQISAGAGPIAVLGFIMFAFMFVVALPAAAQVEFDGVKMGLSGDIETGYDGSLSSPGSSSHGLGLGGTGNLNGSFYNPNFLSFTAQPYYNRAQANADGASVFDSGGYNGNVNFFSGSHFPGNVNFSQVWDATGIFGIPGETGLTTKDSSKAFGVGWSELVPGLPSLTLSYTRGTADSSLPGSDAQSSVSTNSVSINSSYRLAGWSLNGGFAHLTSDTNSNGLLGSDEGQITNTSTNSYTVGTGHSLPLSGGFGLSYSRTDYDSSLIGDVSGTNKGTTDNINGNLGLKVWRLPVTANATYSDNVYGSFEQQLLSSGGTLLFTDLLPETRSLLVNVGTGYAVTPHIFVTGFLNRQELWLGDAAYGVTQLGANVNFNMGKFIKGLTVMVGANDNANKQGNLGMGMVANVNYNRNIGHWELGAYYNYSQNVQTLLAIYQTSSMTYNGTIRRRFADGLSWTLSGGGGRTAFEQVAGNGSSSWGVSSGVSWFRTSLSGNYSVSSGTSVLTPTGLVPVPVPVITNNLIVFDGKSRGATFSTIPLRRLTISMAYSKANSNTLALGGTTPGTTSMNETELYTGIMTYRLRKLNFNANVVQFRQGLSGAGIPPSVVTSYYFGISRWFKAF
jgi:hypothetical protein